MKRLLVALVTVFAFGACSSGSSQPGAVRSAGTLALTGDDALLYAVDADSEIVTILDAITERKVAEVKVGNYPEQILIGPDDTAYVANRGDRSLSVFSRGAWDQVRRVPVGVEPVGLALSPDGKTLYVVNATSLADSDHGSLTAIDTASLQAKWEMELPSDPRGIAILDEKRAVISRYRPGDLIEVDLTTQKITRGSTNIATQVNRLEDGSGLGAFPAPSVGPSDVKPRAMGQVVVSPNGAYVYTPVVWASDAILNGTTSVDGSSGGAYGGGGTCGQGGAVTSPGVATFEAGNLDARVDALKSCFQTEGRDYPATVMTDPTFLQPVQGPTVLLVEPTGSWMFVANRESNNVTVMPTSRGGSGGATTFDLAPINGGVHQVLEVGEGPTGMAISSDGRKLYVHSSFSHDVRLITSNQSSQLRVVSVMKAAEDVLPADVVEGRKLFFSAADARMNNPQIGISCASCHLDGREDGHVWNFMEGPRQTPSLAGRAVSTTAPFHWGGEHVDFASFVDHTVGQRMGGAGLDSESQRKLLAYIDAIPTPDNPNRLSAPTDAQKRGAQVFQKAGCTECHAGAALTNNTFANVGTYVTDGPVIDDQVFLAKGLNTPSLLGVARTAPYLHDGSAPTLKDRILRDRQRGSDAHGQVSVLSDAEIADLVAYLKVL